MDGSDLIRQKIKWIIYGVFLCTLFFSFTFVQAEEHEGQENEATMKKGVVIYTTTDTTASTSITWGTVGFTVRNGETDGNPIVDKNYGVLDLEDGEKRSFEKGGRTYTTFKFSGAKVNDEFEHANVNSVSLDKNGGNVYLNAIIQVYHSGTPYKKPKKTLTSIMGAEEWANKKDFYDRFDIKLPYDPIPQPVNLTIMKYSNSNGYKEVDIKGVSGELTRLPTHKTYKTNTSTIPGTITSDTTGNTLYLYRVYWARLKEDKHEYAQGYYRKPRDKLSIDSSVNPLTNWEGYKAALQPLRNRSGESTDKYTNKCPFYEVVYGGIEIVCVYRSYKTPPTDGSGTSEEIGEDIIDPYTSASILADYRFRESFNSEEGVPTNETQYVSAYTDEFLVQYKFVHYSGWQEFLKKVGKKYVAVKRNYSYWKIEDLNVYSISYAKAYNYSLPGGYAYLTPTSYYHVPQINYQVHSTNMIPPEGGGKGVGHYTVWNDSLTFNGETIMDSTHCQARTSTPKSLPKSGRANAYALFQSGYLIDSTKANGEYGSNGVICYIRTTHYGDDAEGTMITYDIDDINDVTVHTPVICDAKIEDVKKYNQLIHPDTSVASLVLDTNFNVTLPTKGYHSDLKGYGTRDYAKYTKSREVKFPFDVMKSGTLVAANTWTSISDTTQFYLPVWVNEGQYTVEFRTRSINCDANAGINKAEDLANTNFENYVATDTVDVEVSGRIYNFNLYDVSDYPDWQSVFRNKDSLKFTGVNYTVGTRDRNGKEALDWSKQKFRTTKFTLPLMNGSHPKFAAIGAVKPGYYTRFSVDTIGNYDGEDDYIRITPSFYYVNRKGQNRKKVDVYYTEWMKSTKNKHILVKVGSERDKNNIHSIDRKDSYLTGGTIKGKQSTKKTIKNVYTFGNIMIPDVLMSYTKNKSMQTWICEYYLPFKIYVCEKGYDVADYAKNNNGIHFNEPFWLKDGYLIVNFEIETIINKERHLSYINADNTSKGYCNMWKLEGGVSAKQDSYGNTFSILDGDYVMYELASNKNVNFDYKTGGMY